jgi:hypothetical protein
MITAHRLLAVVALSGAMAFPGTVVAAGRSHCGIGVLVRTAGGILCGKKEGTGAERSTGSGSVLSLAPRRSFIRSIWATLPAAARSALPDRPWLRPLDIVLQPLNSNR